MDFLARKPNPYVPTYSLPAIADKSNISKALANTAPIIPAFDRDHDGQLTRDDAIVPGSKLLGAARSDHFALALVTRYNPIRASGPVESLLQSDKLGSSAKSQ